jgi:LytS/YehU family sensor histidine kinase
MPLVENCFKHVSSYADRINTIVIRCSREGESFLFYTCNSRTPDAPEGGGIGLLNIRKRLELLYPGRHALTTRQTTDHFEAILKLEC